MKKIHTTITDFLIESYSNNITQDELDEILNGYLECALQTEEESLLSDYEEDVDDEDDNEEDDDIGYGISGGGRAPKENGFDGKVGKNPNINPITIDNIASESKIEALNDIKKFIQMAGDEAVYEAVDTNGLSLLGQDIQLTRNGHGSGFFERGYVNGDKLTKAADSLKEMSMYIGNDGKLYFGF